MSNRFVTYLRVSTVRQGISGLGLDAQRSAVTAHISSVGGASVAEFVEIESGRKSNRPQLLAALAACKAMKATLLVAKIDRLSRNLAFLCQLQDSGVDFIACDMPSANRFTVQIMAAVAEQEAAQISARTKAALAAAKARGVKLGTNNLPAFAPELAARARAARSAKCRDHALQVAPYVAAARAAGCTSLRQIAAALTARGVATMTGGAWHACTVANLLALDALGAA